MLRIAFVTFFLVFCAGAEAKETICAPSVPAKLDPHQIQFPLEREIAARLYRPLLPSPGAERPIVKELKQQDPKTWRMTLEADLRFNQAFGWKGTRGLTAVDVQWSLMRQLTKNATNLFEEQTFLPAKFSGLDQHLREVRIVSPLEVELAFAKNVTREELNEMLAPPVGYIISKEFKDYMDQRKRPVSFFPATSGQVIGQGNNGGLELIPEKEMKPLVGNKGIVQFRPFKQREATLKEFRAAGCTEVYFPTAQFLQSLSLNKVPYKLRTISKTRVFLLLNPRLALDEPRLSALHSELRPAKLETLRGMEHPAGIFGTSPIIFSSSQAPSKRKEISVELAYCDPPNLPELSMERTVMEIKNILEKRLTAKLMPSKLECRLTHSQWKSAQVAATLMTLNYSDDEELIKRFNCAIQPKLPFFGFCLDNLAGKDQQSAKREIDGMFNRFKYLIPLVEQQDSFVRF
jgi:hypothetical protein